MIHLSHNPQPKWMQVVIVAELFSLAVIVEQSVLLWSLHALQDVKIFQKDFLFVPIHDVLHWSLVIVCHPALLPQVAAASHSGEAPAAATTGWDRLPPAQAAAAAAQARATAAAVAVATAGGGSQSGDEQLEERTESAGAAAATAAAAAATFARKPVILHLDSMSSKQPRAPEQPLLLKRIAPAVLCQQAVQAVVWQLHCTCILLHAGPPRF
jgi:pyruvate/2-oxoglutarate dehydrogenase complex dihydrolipoamide acyltransferase (E2) component